MCPKGVDIFRSLTFFVEEIGDIFMEKSPDIFMESHTDNSPLIALHGKHDGGRASAGILSWHEPNRRVTVIYINNMQISLTAT